MIKSIPNWINSIPYITKFGKKSIGYIDIDELYIDIDELCIYYNENYNRKVNLHELAANKNKLDLFCKTRMNDTVDSSHYSLHWQSTEVVSIKDLI